jgi:hypothetical protein
VTSNDSKEQNDNSHDKKNVDQTACDMKDAETEDPKDKEDEKECEHGDSYYL